MPGSVRTLALVLLLLPAPALAQSRTVERGWRLASDGAVRVFNMSGPTRVIGWDRDSVAVTATLAAGERLEGGGAAAGVKMFVDVPDESRPGGTALVIRVPARARVWVKGSADPVDVAGVTGGLDLYTVGGTIRVSGAPRELRAESMQGDVELAVTSPWVRAKTAAGAIVLRGAMEDAGAETVSGRVAATLASARRVRLESVTGDVSLGGAMERDGAVTVETHSGAVEIALPKGTAADYDVTTIAAPIENLITAQHPMATRVRGGSELHMSTGGGGVIVTVRSFKGKVVLRAR